MRHLMTMACLHVPTTFLLVAALCPLPGFGQEVLTTERVQALLQVSGVKAPRAGRLASAESGRGSREFLLSWKSPQPLPPNSSRAASTTIPQVLSQRNWDQDAPRQRAPQLSEELILVAALDKDDTLQSWTLINDPRVLRSEAPTATGPLAGQVFQHDSANFSIVLPADPSVTSLRLYKPVWNGQEFQLTLLTAMVLP